MVELEIMVGAAPQKPLVLSESSQSGHAMLDNPEMLKAAISEKARELGFDIVRFTSAAPFPEAQRVLEERIDAGLLSGLTWFTKERASVAGDPRNLMPGVQTIVSLGISYLSSEAVQGSVPGVPRGRVARYAWGLDYHEVFKEKLWALHAYTQSLMGRNIEARALVDTARIVDRAVAQRAGLGWYGKNTNILNRQFGSWVLLGELLLDVVLPPDEPVKTHCGTCTRCLPSCPTGALIAPGVLDNDRCISYLTIELRGPIPREMRPLISDWIFGCDICQEVCPVNRKALPGDHPEFSAQMGIGPSPSLIELLDITQEEFRERFRHSPVKRAKWEGLRRNVAVALGNIGDPAAIPALIRALNCESSLVRGHAAWALGRIGGLEARPALVARQGLELDTWVLEEIALALQFWQ
ncbi:MAG TPA: tRNA epoxyqueuosine(34) reductase QueG [Chloroflexia bacterium]|nr:tRNA epoxyqueuosine(34) reductase QueG [Chloroflexia bacterium]